MNRLSETHRFLQISSFWEARCTLKLRKCYTPTHVVMPCLSHVATSGDIITDCNDLYCILRIALCCANITMSAFVIRETPYNKHDSTQLKTRVWIVSGKFFKYENLQAVSQKCQTVLARLEKVLRKSIWAQLAGYSQVQEIFIRKMHCTHSNMKQCCKYNLNDFLFVSSFGSPILQRKQLVTLQRERKT